MFLHRRSLMVSASALAALLAVTGTAVAGSSTSDSSLGTIATTAPIRVSGPTPFTVCGADDPAQFRSNSETETIPAVNPTNPSNIVTVWQQDRYLGGSSRGIVVGVSRDSGRSWTPVVVPGLSCPAVPGRATNPWLSFAGNGDLYATATVVGATSAVLVAKSTDGGSTWGAATVLVNDPRFEKFSDKQTSIVDPADPNRVYVVWNRKINAENRHEILLARSTDRGASWEPTRPIYSPAGSAGTVGSQIVVLRDGSLLNVFFQNDVPIGTPPGPTLTEHVKAIRSTDRGTTWSAPVTIADIRLNIPLLPDTGLPLIAPGLVPDVAVDKLTGAVYVVWADANLSTSRSAVGMSVSLNGGRTWSAPLRVDRSPESAAGGAGQAFLPQIDVAGNGTVAVTYYDFRNNTPEAGASTDVWMATCWGPVCGYRGDVWTERHLAGPFGIDSASVSFGGPFVGTYVGLTHRPGWFVSSFVMTTGDAANPQDVYVVRTRALPWIP